MTAGLISTLTETLAEADLPRSSTATVKVSATATAPASSTRSLGDLSLTLAFLAAVGASVMLLVPATRRTLNLRRTR